MPSEHLKMQEILTKCKLALPLKINGKQLFKQCKRKGVSRYKVSLDLLEVSSTTGRTISLSDEYQIEIDNDFKITIDRVIPVK